MITLLRIIQAGLRNFRRNAWLSTAATAVMTVTLTIILASFISTAALSATIKSIVNKIDVAIYLKDAVTADQRDTMQNQLEGIDNVVSVNYVSKQEALDRFRGQNKANAKLLEAVSDQDNALPASFEIKAKDPKKLDSIAAYVNSDSVKPLVENFSYQGDRKTTIDRIVRASNFLKTTGIIASIIFAIISILIIFNTIRMAIFTRREEVEIMKLVGATNWFIRGPFIFEAMLYGIIGAVLATSLCYLVLLVGGPRLGSYVDVGSTISTFRHLPFLIFLVELAIGTFIGALSSLLALSRYLKLS
jgi:cell division transport system permease protein